MNRLIILFALITLTLSTVFAQSGYMRIHKSDGTSTEFQLSGITKITFDFTGVSNNDFSKLNKACRPLLLLQNFPNPCSPNTTIEYTLPQQIPVELNVYNITGQLVRTLVNRIETAGQHKVYWNGCDDDNHHIANGAYIYQLKAGGRIMTRKLIILK